MAANREYKNSVFTLLFSDPALLRELYGAIAGVELPPDVPVVINTLEDALYDDLINDLSFLMDDKLIIFSEHQSTKNPNMALRLLMYAGRVYEKITANADLYGSKPVSIPRPEFIVLYNGRDPAPDVEVLRLSVLFKDAASLGAKGLPPLELIVRVYNINEGRNTDIAARCETLRQYSVFIARAREFGAEKAGRGPFSNRTRREAIKKAVEWCIGHDILKGFLTIHATEVINMLTKKIKFEDIVMVRERDAREMALEEGRKMGREEGIEKGIEKGIKMGREEGIEKGIEKDRREILALINQGYSIEQLKEKLAGGSGQAVGPV